MTSADLLALLERLRAEPREAEWLEFKQNHTEPDELGQYLSALANGAALHGKPRAYLVYGVDDATHAVVGTTFDPAAKKAKGHQPLLLWLAQGLKYAAFELHALDVGGKRILLFEVHPASDRPATFYGTAYVRVGSSKTALANHPDKERRLWQGNSDWSAEIVERATLADLDPDALVKARTEFLTKHAARAEEVAAWDDVTFLNKLKLTVQGAVTRAALVLLGRPESTALLSPAVARISWFLRDERNEPLDYEHLDPPFILQVDRVLAKIRNLTLRHLPSGTLFPIELRQYDPWVLREALHNCIAHEDYRLACRIQVVETPDTLILTNAGGFLPGTVETVIERDAPYPLYRNPLLAEAMVSLNMIDTQGGGIKKMFLAQRRRFFPLPDYDLSEPESVTVRLRGRILDEGYTQLLMERTDLDLSTIMLLDRIQKRREVTREEHRRLNAAGLVEGRFPNLVVSARVAAATGDKARHIRDRGLDTRYYRDLIVELIRTHGPVVRADIDRLLMDKLPEVLSEAQKRERIHGLLAVLARKEQRIRNAGTRRYPKWVLAPARTENQ